jgi:hypothetical protein
VGCAHVTRVNPVVHLPRDTREAHPRRPYLHVYEVLNYRTIFHPDFILFLQKPKSFSQAFNIRMALLYADMREDWLPKVPHSWQRKPRENVTSTAETNDVSTENRTTPARNIDKLRKHLPLTKQSTSAIQETNLSQAGSSDNLIPNQSRRQSDVNSVMSSQENPYSTGETILPEDQDSGKNTWNKFSPFSIPPLYLEGDDKTRRESIIGMPEQPLGKYKIGQGSLVGLTENSAGGDKMLTGSLIGLSDSAAESNKSPGLFARKLRGLKVDPELSNVDI